MRLQPASLPAHKRFTIRVYAFLWNNGQVLVSRETYKGMDMCKLPGGGLEFGESVTHCLVRELQEELGLRVANDQLRLVHVCESMIISKFDENAQVIGIYYSIEMPEKQLIGLSPPVRATNASPGLDILGFTWVQAVDLPQLLSFDMDKEAFIAFNKALEGK